MQVKSDLRREELGDCSEWLLEQDRVEGEIWGKGRMDCGGIDEDYGQERLDGKGGKR